MHLDIFVSLNLTGQPKTPAAVWVRASRLSVWFYALWALPTTVSKMADSRQKWLPNRDMSRPCTAHDRERRWLAHMFPERISSHKSISAEKGCNGSLFRMWRWSTETMLCLSTCHSVQNAFSKPWEWTFSSAFGFLEVRATGKVKVNMCSAPFVFWEMCILAGCCFTKTYVPILKKPFENIKLII